MQRSMDLPLGWAAFQVDVAIVFNFVSRVAVFRELQHAGEPLPQLILFVYCFYSGIPPLFYRACGDDRGLQLLASASDTRERDPLEGALFALAHFQALHARAFYLPGHVLDAAFPH